MLRKDDDVQELLKGTLCNDGAETRIWKIIKARRKKPSKYLAHDYNPL